MLLGVCALPLLVRFLGPFAAVRDGFYGHGAWMLANGFEPYTDFTQVAFPFLERYLALWIDALGPHLRVVEAAGRVVVLGVAAALYVAGRRVAGPWAGGAAALLWSWNVWVVFFNLVERETYAALGTALALALYVRGGTLTWRRAAAVAAALLLAFTMKITAVMPAVALCAHLALTGRPREMLRLGATYAGMVVATTALCALAWGEPFLWQTYVFGFFRNARGDTLATVVRHLDPTLAIGLLSALLWALPRWREPVGAALFVLALDLVYMVGVSPTVWDHNMINLAVPLALLGGAGVDALVGRSRAPTAPLAALAATIAFVLVAARAGERWPALAARWGLGGRPGAEVEARGAVLARHSAPGETVVCLEPWAAFVADRPKFVRYWDLEPVARGVEASLRADGLRATLGKRDGTLVIGPGLPEPDPRVLALKDPYIARLAANGLHWVRPALLDALAERRVAFVLEDLPPGVLTADDLRAAGYERVEDGGYAGWRPRDGVADAGVRPIYSR